MPEKWTIAPHYDSTIHQGWPILLDGQVVAVASYRGGTEPARRMAQRIVDALQGVPPSSRDGERG